MADPRVVLVSASPRRRSLLRELLVDDATVVVAPADVDEAAIAAGLAAEQGVAVVAGAKLQRALERVLASEAQADAWLLAADTIVLAPDREVLGKPADAADAARMMRKISGATIHVVTAVSTARSADAVTTDVVTTAVDLGPIEEAAIAAYLQTDIPWDKAGALELQGASAQFVTGFHGCWSNVIGLPLCVVAERLSEVGLANLLRPNGTATCRH